jgi:hypothetical protein
MLLFITVTMTIKHEKSHNKKTRNLMGNVQKFLKDFK